MPAPSQEEITQKLADLKAYSREFDRYRACMRSTNGEQVNEAYRAMLEAEKNYVALSDWFINQHLHVFWHRERQEYLLLPSIQVEVRLKDRHHPTSDTSDTTATTDTSDTISNARQKKTPHEKVEPQVSVEERTRPW